MTAGVYAIVNATTGAVYVGSSVNIERRWTGRRGELNQGRSANRVLQAEWSAVQGEGFELRILEPTAGDNDALLNAETRWIETLRAENKRLYNLRAASAGRHGFPMGRKRWGWAWVAKKRKAHYFRFGDLSLCGQARRLYARDFEDDVHDSPDNCVPCQKLIEERRPKRRRRPPGSAE